MELTAFPANNGDKTKPFAVCGCGAAGELSSKDTLTS
jgi:hypothetical protein